MCHAELHIHTWVTHAQFEGVASRVKDEIESLFDSDKPHFAVWINLYDIDSESESGRTLRLFYHYAIPHSLDPICMARGSRLCCTRHQSQRRGAVSSGS